MAVLPFCAVSPPSLYELWRASFARFVYDYAYFCKQKKSTDSRKGLPSVALAKDGGADGSDQGD